MATSDEVWGKGKVVSDNPHIWRKDFCDAWIKYSEYGNRNSTYGWEIDHVTPKDKGGSDSLSNLRPLQWENNVSKSNGKLGCAVTSSGAGNVYK